MKIFSFILGLSLIGLLLWLAIKNIIVIIKKIKEKKVKKED